MLKKVKVEVTEKKIMKIFKVFFGSGFVLTHGWASCSKTWLEF